MSAIDSSGFDTYFSALPDPRISRKKLYPLTEILFVVLCGSVCGAESWRDFVLFGKEKIDFLREYYPFANGIASKDTFARVFAVLDPEAFKSCFVGWVKSLQSALQDVIAIDIDWLSQKSEWAGLNTIAMIEETCDIKGLYSPNVRSVKSSVQPQERGKIPSLIYR